MGFEYRHYMIPRPNTTLPEPAAVARLLARLAEERWLPSKPDHGDEGQLQRFGAQPLRVPHGARPAWYLPHVATGADVKVVWGLDDPVKRGLRVPLDFDGAGSSPIDYSVEVHLSGRDYFFETSEIIEGLEEHRCECGESLETTTGRTPVAIFYSGEDRIAFQCPSCESVFDPTDLPVGVRNWVTGRPGVVKGGAYYRFALVIDSGKRFPSGPEVKLDPDLRDVASRELGCSFYEIGSAY
jgi:hypothetical protein